MELRRYHSQFRPFPMLVTKYQEVRHCRNWALGVRTSYMAGITKQNLTKARIYMPFYSEYVEYASEYIH